MTAIPGFPNLFTVLGPNSPTPIAAAMGPTVWNTGCNSWYFADNNHIDLWPFDRHRLRTMLGQPHDEDYVLSL